MSILVDPIKDINIIKEINSKFNIDFEALEFLGSGAGGEAFKIDDISVLKITGDELETGAIRKLVGSGIIFEPGFARVLPDDMLSVQLDGYFYLVYRIELLWPAKKALKWSVENSILDEKTADFIVDKIWELQRICVEHNKFDAEELLKEIKESYLISFPMFVPLVSALYEAAKEDIFLIDVHKNNLGFRFDEEGKPALDDGLVAFDMELK